MPTLIDARAVMDRAVELLYWHGSLSRKELMTELSIGADYASRTIARIKAKIPLTRQGKRYVLSDAQTLPPAIDSTDYLFKLAARTNSPGTLPVQMIGRRRQAAKPGVLRHVIHALQIEAALRIEFVGTEALASDGLIDDVDPTDISTVEPYRITEIMGRWYVHVYCHAHARPLGLDLSRITHCDPPTPAKHAYARTLREGRLTHARQNATFVPHPSLTPQAQTAVAEEFRMTRRQLRLSEPADVMALFRAHFCCALSDTPRLNRVLAEEPLSTHAS